MSERMLVSGNEAIGWGAVTAGCRHFFGYPITPQNEITEWFARELPKMGGVFVQAEAECASVAMLFGAGATGTRVITTTASPGWGLMQEGLSHLSGAEVPCVIVNVQRGGPGGGTTRHAQMDYFSATRGSYGGVKYIVLAPASIQENCDLVQLAFHLADKYRTPVIILSDGIMGQMLESLEVRALDFEPLPAKDWAIVGADHRGGGKRNVISAQGLMGPPWFVGFLQRLEEKAQEIEKAEVRYESYQAEDAQLLLVAYGSTARICEEAVDIGRSDGLKVGLIRPVTLCPFPKAILRQKADQGCTFLVVEDSMGQMVEDVQLALEGRSKVNLLGIWGRHLPTDQGMILPERVHQEVKGLL